MDKELNTQIAKLLNLCESNEFFKLSLFDHFGHTYIKIESIVNENIYSINIDKIQYITFYDDKSLTIRFFDSGYFYFNYCKPCISTII